MLLKNKTAVITGCNRGIGLEILKVFVKNDIKEVFACVREISKDFLQNIKEIAHGTKTIITPIELDLSNEESVKTAGKEIILSAKNIDILINNAGSISTSLFQMTSLETTKKIFSINFFSQILFSQYIVKAMIKNKSGSIIFVSSTSALDGNIGRTSYSSSKSALNTLAITLSKELGSKNIRVNVIAPGLTNTDMMKDNTSEDTIKEVVNNCSLNRVAESQEIANAILFFSCDLSSYITGQILRVDGGMK